MVVTTELIIAIIFTIVGIMNEGFYYYVIDEFNKICAEGEKGQLVLGGVAVAGGYIGQQGLTDNVFVQNHCHSNFDDLVYLTGDLVSKSNETIQIHGRIDNQVKVNGFRIELEEVENIINSIDYVVECMAFLWKNSLDLNEICLLCVLEENSAEIDLEVQIQGKLPNYMKPRTILPVRELFKNPAGKLDRAKNLAFYWE